jgi:hypothetical protein
MFTSSLTSFVIVNTNIIVTTAVVTIIVAIAIVVTVAIIIVVPTAVTIVTITAITIITSSSPRHYYPVIIFTSLFPGRLENEINSLQVQSGRRSTHLRRVGAQPEGILFLSSFLVFQHTVFSQ